MLVVYIDFHVIVLILCLFAFQIESNASLPSVRPLSKEELWRYISILAIT